MEQKSIPPAKPNKSGDEGSADEKSSDEYTQKPHKELIPPNGNVGSEPKTSFTIAGLLFVIIEALALALWQMADSFHGYTCVIAHWLSLCGLAAGPLPALLTAIRDNKRIWIWVSYFAVFVVLAINAFVIWKPQDAANPAEVSPRPQPVVLLLPTTPVEPLVFRQKHEEIELMVGGGTFRLPPVPQGEWAAKDIGRAFLGIGTHEHPSDIGMLASENQIVFNIKFAPVFGMPALVLTNNALSGLPSSRDFNHSPKAIEVVNEQLVPVFQLYYKDDTHLVFNGAITYIDRSRTGVVLFSESRIAMGIVPDDLFHDIQNLNLRRLFKYPAWKYPGQFEDNPSSDNTKTEPSLRDLFKSDFDNYPIKVGKPIQIRTAKDGPIIAEVNEQVYYDFQAQSKFISFYVPNSKDTFEVCVGLAFDCEGLVSRIETWGLIYTKAPGEQRDTETGDLRFTGRVYIYHEYPLRSSQIESLQAVFKEHGLSVLFRGNEYLFQRLHPPSP